MTKKLRSQIRKEAQQLWDQSDSVTGLRGVELIESVIIKYYVDGQASVIAPLAEIVAKTAQDIGDSRG